LGCFPNLRFERNGAGKEKGTPYLNAHLYFLSSQAFSGNLSFQPRRHSFRIFCLLQCIEPMDLVKKKNAGHKKATGKPSRPFALERILPLADHSLLASFSCFHRSNAVRSHHKFKFLRKVHIKSWANIIQSSSGRKHRRRLYRHYKTFCTTSLAE